MLLCILALNTGWFVIYAAALGFDGAVASDPTTVSRVFREGAWVANSSLALHMMAGAVLTIGAPLQAIPIVRYRWNPVHQRVGYVLVSLALVTGVSGFIYILAEGTIGGPWMSLWFSLYGAAMVVSAVQVWRTARLGAFQRHFEWATRLVILAVGSWIYRMHYASWYGLTDGAASNRAFTGLFDQVQVVAFFVPYLVVAEVLLWRARRRHVRYVSV